MKLIKKIQKSLLYCAFFFLQAINLFAQGRCTGPRNVNITNVSANTAFVTWNPVSNALYYKVQLRNLNDSLISEVQTESTNKLLTDLSPNTTYKLKVGTVCTNNANNPVYSPSINFTTSALGPLITDVIIMLDGARLGSNDAKSLYAYCPPKNTIWVAGNYGIANNALNLTATDFKSHKLWRVELYKIGNNKLVTRLYIAQLGANLEEYYVLKCRDTKTQPKHFGTKPNTHGCLYKIGTDTQLEIKSMPGQSVAFNASGYRIALSYAN